MKKILLTVFAVALTISFLSTAHMAQAIPMGAAQNTGDYFLGDQDMRHWTVGAYYLDRDRDIRTLGRLTPMRTTKQMAYVGYEFIYGLSGFVTVGSTETQFERLHLVDTHSEYGVGLQFNILDHEIPDPTLMEDRITVNATFQYTLCGADWLATEIDWEEYYGSLIVGLINDIEGNKYYYFNSIGFFFGAVYSGLQSSSMKAESPFGYCAGINLYFSDKIAFEFGMESVDNGAIFGGIHISL